MIRKILLSLTVLCASIICFSQDNSGQFHGDFDLNLQSYQEDLQIGAEAADEVILTLAISPVIPCLTNIT